MKETFKMKKLHAFMLMVMIPEREKFDFARERERIMGAK